MPRNSTDTKSRLLDEAERLFAERGIYNVTNREITEAAGQKNVSALNYHFGSRGQLLAAMLVDRGAALDAERERLGRALGDEAATAELVEVLVTAYAACLHTEGGRNYVRIVDQLRAGMSDWRTGAAAGDVHLQRVLDQLEQRPAEVPHELRRERLVAMMMLMTGMTAARAQHLADGRSPALDHDTFVAALVDMLVGVLTAPARRPRLSAGWK